MAVIDPCQTYRISFAHPETGRSSPPLSGSFAPAPVIQPKSADSSTQAATTRYGCSTTAMNSAELGCLQQGALRLLRRLDFRKIRLAESFVYELT
jgi:hypothetical protein